MAKYTVPILGNSSQPTVDADDTAAVNTIVKRDSAGGIVGNTMQGSTLRTTGNLQKSVSTQTASFTAGAATDYLVDATGGAVTVTFPPASANAGVEYQIVKKDSSVNAVTLSGVSGTTSLPSQWNKARVISDGTTWYAV